MNKFGGENEIYKDIILQKSIQMNKREIMKS